MEKWDAYDRQRKQIGVELVRGKIIPNGLFHLVVNVLVQDSKGAFLFVKRSQEKESNSAKVLFVPGTFKVLLNILLPSGKFTKLLSVGSLMTLPEKQRMVFNLKYYQEMKYEEMSEIFGTTFLRNNPIRNI